MSQLISEIFSFKLVSNLFLLIGLLFSCQSEIYFKNAYCIENVNVIDPLDDGATVAAVAEVTHPLPSIVVASPFVADK